MNQIYYYEVICICAALFIMVIFSCIFFFYVFKKFTFSQKKLALMSSKIKPSGYLPYFKSIFLQLSILCITPKLSQILSFYTSVLCNAFIRGPIEC